MVDGNPRAVSFGSFRFLLLGLGLLVALPALAQGGGPAPGKMAEPRQQTAMIKAKPMASQLSSQERVDLRKQLLVTAFSKEVEPNNTFATANPLGATPVRVRADLFIAPFSAGVDVDYYSFTAGAGDRVYAAVMTDSVASGNSILDILDTNGTAVLETDDNDGTVGIGSSNIAGRVLPAAGTYFVRVRQFNVTSLTGTIRPYDLYVRVLSGSPTAEAEPNNYGTPQPMTPNGWMSGVINPAGDTDTFQVAANAGDTIVAILDVDPERNSPEWDGRVGIGIFNGFFLVADGSKVGFVDDDPNPSEALFFTVDTMSATWQIYVDEALAGGAVGDTYNLSVSVIPGNSERIATETCTGTTGPIADLATTDFTCTFTNPAILDHLQLRLSETHGGGRTNDLDVSLLSPEGNEVVVFHDPPGILGAAAPQIDTLFDDEAAMPIALNGAFGIHSGMRYQPRESALEFFRGMQAAGVWTLRVRDDNGGDVGALNSWSLTAYGKPIIPGCGTPTTLLAANFDTTDDGFTHSGTADEWARGVPTGAPIDSCHSGSCFEIDLASTYENNSNQNLVSPNVNLVGATTPIALTWWQKYSLDSASSHSAWVEVRQVGNPANSRRVWEWKGGIMSAFIGNPATTVQMSAGWGRVQADISDFAGLNVEVVYHLETPSFGQLDGWGIDDFLVQSACAVPVGLLGFEVE